MCTGDKYGDGNWDVIPTGSKKGRRWSELQGCTLRSILRAVVDLNFIQLDERRIAAIKTALEAKGPAAPNELRPAEVAQAQ